MPSSEFGPDGTQAPPPPRLYPDPLAGLVTADSWRASQVSGQWSEYVRSRVVAPIPPTQTEEMRQAIQVAIDEERRQRLRGRSRAQTPAPTHHTWQAAAPVQQSAQQFAQMVNKAAGQQNQAPQPAQKSGGTAAVIGCLVVLGFFILVIVNIIGAIIN